MRLFIFLSGLRPYEMELGKGLVGDIVKIFLYHINIWEHIGPETKILGLTQAQARPVGAQDKNFGPGSGPGPRFVVRFFSKKK